MKQINASLERDLGLDTCAQPRDGKPETSQLHTAKQVQGGCLGVATKTSVSITVVVANVGKPCFSAT